MINVFKIDSNVFYLMLLIDIVLNISLYFLHSIDSKVRQLYQIEIEHRLKCIPNQIVFICFSIASQCNLV